jgi:cobalt-zinc-cadmium efflux system protein
MAEARDHHHHGENELGHSSAHRAGGHHHHAAPRSGFDSAFAIGAALNAGFVVAEVIFGIAANSVALLADAAHNLGDVLGLLLAWGAAWLGRRQPTRKHTYGYGRSSILASLTNAVVLLIGVGAIAVESLRRLFGDASDGEVGGITVMVVAAIGIVVNGGTAFLFARGRKGDLNIRGAFLHMASDAAVAFGVVIAGLMIFLTGWAWLDPAVSLVIAVFITISTWSLLRDSLNLALDKMPEWIDRDAVEGYLRGLPNVTEVHDLHIWALSTTDIALTVHLVRPTAGTDDALLRRACDELRTCFGIGHATFQLEDGNGDQPCELAPDHVV